jgi:nitrile hydratase subunit beta
MKKSINDIGGEDWGPIPLKQKETPDWAKLSTALRAALGDKGAGLVNLHEGRRAREEMGYERYHALGYFEMGMQAIYDILVQKGVVTEQEVADRIAALKAVSK